MGGRDSASPLLEPHRADLVPERIKSIAWYFSN